MKYQYTEYKPSEHLRNIIDCYWSFDTDDSYLSLTRHPVIPDACIDLIWSIDRPDCSSRLVGPMTAPFFSDLAAAGGYSDQSHMIHDFRKLTSLCPSEYFSPEMLQLYNS